MNSNTTINEVPGSNFQADEARRDIEIVNAHFREPRVWDLDENATLILPAGCQQHIQEAA